MRPVKSPIAALAVGMALEYGADHARAIVEQNLENSVTVLGSETDRIMSSISRTLFLHIFIEGRFGSFTTNMLREEELRRFISSAVEATRLIAKDPCRGLPDPTLYYRGGGADLGQYDSRIEEITPQERLAFAKAITSEVWGREKRLLSIEAEWGDETEHSTCADSAGFEGETLQTSYYASASCSIRGCGEEKPESWWYEGAMFLDKLDFRSCGATALSRGLESADPRRLKTGRYNVVIENTVSSRMVSPIITALSGGSLQQGNSFLRESIGKRVFGENLTIVDRPHTPGLPGSRYFDDEGVATKERDIIRNGVVSNYFISSYYSRKMGIPVTISGPSVLRFEAPSVIEKKELSLTALMKKAGRGILITDFNGGNYNRATGDFSYGIRGFLFEDGVKIHPIREMNITGNLITLWNNLIAAGCDGRAASKWMIPSLAFEGVDFSGT